jgi:hypothetical protein
VAPPELSGAVGSVGLVVSLGSVVTVGDSPPVDGSPLVLPATVSKVSRLAFCPASGAVEQAVANVNPSADHLIAEDGSPHLGVTRAC